MTAVATWIGLATIVIFGIFGVIGLVALLIYLYNQGKLDGTSWRLGLALFIIFWLAKSCFGTHN